MLATTTTHTSMMSARRASLVSSRSTHGAQRAPARAIVRKAIVSEDVDVGKTGAAYTEFASLLDKYQYNYKVGDVISGKIKACDAKGAWVEIGAKSEALCPTSEASLGNVRNAAAVFDIDCDYDFEIIQDDNGEGCMTLSVRRMELAKAWDRCREAQADDAALTGEVLSVNRGGLLVEVEKLRGFVPQSHIGVRTLNREELIGQQLPFKFIEVDEEKNRLVLSHRLATDMVSAEGLEVGDVVEGMVQAVKPYGAFVDVGGQSGLLHISQISHERIVAVENVLSPGDRIKVLVMSKDAEKGRLSLSTKKLEQNHGDMLRNPAAVFETAEDMGRQFREKMQAAEGVVMSVDEA